MPDVDVDLLIVLCQVLVRAEFDGTVESVLGSPLLSVSASTVEKLNCKLVKTIALLLLIIN